jgi:hypothetical protein
MSGFPRRVVTKKYSNGGREQMPPKIARTDVGANQPATEIAAEMPRKKSRCSRPDMGAWR